MVCTRSSIRGVESEITGKEVKTDTTTAALLFLLRLVAFLAGYVDCPSSHRSLPKQRRPQQNSSGTKKRLGRLTSGYVSMLQQFKLQL
eukprot:5279163-Amphidinium_carterae.1